jgi:hypothetical protein
MSEIEASGRVKLISGIPLFIAENGLKLIEGRLDRIVEDDTPLQEGVDIFFGTSAEILKAISNDDPNNKGEVTTIVFATINGKVVPFLVKLAQPAIDAIKDEDNKAVVEYMKGVAVDFVNIYTDDVQKNSEQLTEYMDMIRKSPKTEQVVLYNLLLNRLKKRWEGNPTQEDYLIFIEGVLKELWKLVKGEDEEAAIAALETQILALKSGN